MSVAFSSARPRSKGEVTQQMIQKMLDENHHLIQCIVDQQRNGTPSECTHYQQILHRNLVYLATIADSNQNMQSLLPAPPAPNMGPAGVGQSGGGGSAHPQTNLNDSMASGLTPTSVMQGQMSNVPIMHQQSATPLYPSAQAGGQHYQGQQAIGMMGQGNQGNGIMSQRPMGPYRPSQQGHASSQHMTSPDEFPGAPYGHTHSSGEPVNRQYYPDGHGEFSYQQSSYGEQGYERAFDESPQHYYEGGNSQYSQQQQAQYQQGSAQFNQYPPQQGYSAQPQSYGPGPGQGGSSQYSQYQQGQGQQYGSYRPAQNAPGAQTQRPYAYEQGQYGNYQQ